MKNFKFIIALIFSLSSLFTSFADESIDNWKYYKEIEHNNKNLYKSFFLDEEIYRYSENDLADIRIVNEKNEFIPYYIYNKYLQNRNESLIEYQSKRVHSYVDSKENKKYMDFQITPEDSSTDIIANKIFLNIDRDNFFKKIEIYGSYDNVKWEFIKDDEIYRVNELENLNVTFNNVYKYTYYKIIFLDDIENTVIDNLKLIYSANEVSYDEYKVIKKAHYTLESDNEKNDTIIYINNENNLKIQDIEIISNDNFKRKYFIYFKDINQEEFKQFDSGEIYQIDLESFKARKTNIGVDIYQGFKTYPQVIKIIINNKDNEPINISDIKISYLVDKIVFKGDGSSKYKILFGNSDVHMPSYDINSYKNHIENETQESCHLLNLVEQKVIEEKPQKEINYNLIFNITITVISLLLIIIIIRKIKF